jgi:hypothetical protein
MSSSDATWEMQRERWARPHSSALLLLFLLLAVPSSAQLQSSVNFSLLQSAPWPGRHNHQLHELRLPLSYASSRDGSSVVLPPGSFVLWGGQDSNAQFNDVWAASADLRTWDIIAGCAGSSRAWPPHDVQSYSAPMSAATCADEWDRLYVLGGRAVGTGLQQNDSWVSIDGGPSWQLRSALPNATQFTARESGNCLTDRHSWIYSLNGVGNGVGHHDLWRSTDFAMTWELLPAPPMSRYHLYRAAAFDEAGSDLDLLYVLGGGQAIGPSNAVWLSTDDAGSWTELTHNAAWPARNRPTAAVSEVSAVMVLTGGYIQYRAPLTDVWLSLDGGRNWQQLTDSAPWPQRQEQSVTINTAGRMLMAGGITYDDLGRSVLFNDVWTSTGISMNDVAALAELLNVTLPACGRAGLMPYACGSANKSSSSSTGAAFSSSSSVTSQLPFSSSSSSSETSLLPLSSSSSPLPPQWSSSSSLPALPSSSSAPHSSSASSAAASSASSASSLPPTPPQSSTSQPSAASSPSSAAAQLSSSFTSTIPSSSGVAESAEEGHPVILIAAVLVMVLCVASAGLLGCLWWRRRKARQQQSGSEGIAMPMNKLQQQRGLSRPLLHNDAVGLFV